MPSQPRADLSELALPMFTRHFSYRLEDYLRLMEQRRLHLMNRGASKDTIEKNTFPHKYKRVSIQLLLVVNRCLLLMND